MATSIRNGPGEIVVPLEFLRRKGGGTRASKAAAAAAPEPEPLPEEAVAQEHQLRLNFGAKTSAGVRLQGGPSILAALPAMLDDIAKTRVEVVEPRVTTLASATTPLTIRSPSPSSTATSTRVAIRSTRRSSAAWLPTGTSRPAT
jgi:hypothetical protein